MDLLTKETASQYVKNYFADTSDVEITHTFEWLDNGTLVIGVEFNLGAASHTFDVWKEGGKLYGEW